MNNAFFIDTSHEELANFDASKSYTENLPPLGVYADVTMQVTEVALGETKNRKSMIELTFQFLTGDLAMSKFKLRYNTMHENLVVVNIAKKGLMNIAGAIDNIRKYGVGGFNIGDPRYLNKPFIGTLTVTNQDEKSPSGTPYRQGNLHDMRPTAGWNDLPPANNQPNYNNPPANNFNNNGYQQPQQPVYNTQPPPATHTHNAPVNANYGYQPQPGAAPQQPVNNGNPNYYQPQPGQPPVNVTPGQQQPIQGQPVNNGYNQQPPAGSKPGWAS